VQERSKREALSTERPDLFLFLRTIYCPLTILRLLRRYKRGALTYRQLGEAARFQVGSHTLASYIGYAVKAGG
jgi:hypothetical protein